MVVAYGRPYSYLSIQRECDFMINLFGDLNHNIHSRGFLGLLGHISSQRRLLPIGRRREYLWWRFSLSASFLNPLAPAL